MKNFVNNTPSQSVQGSTVRSQFPNKWHSVPLDAGGSNLHTVADTVKILQVNLIRQLIRHCRAKLNSPPKWFTAQVAFDSALQGQGKGLDFSTCPYNQLRQLLDEKTSLSIGNERFHYGTLAVLHRKTCQYLSHHGIYRVSTFCVCFGSAPDSSTRREALSGSSINTARLLTRAVDTLSPR
ncbi:hypothetical protein Plhal304r1_c016g0059411 [Plasmopara halstedii]